MFAAEAHIKYNNACVSLMSIDRGHLEYKQPLSMFSGPTHYKILVEVFRGMCCCICLTISVDPDN